MFSLNFSDPITAMAHTYLLLWTATIQMIRYHVDLLLTLMLRLKFKEDVS